MEVDEALGKLGAIGRWQILYYTVISITCSVPPCVHILAIIYIGKCTFAIASRLYIVYIVKLRLHVIDPRHAVNTV